MMMMMMMMRIAKANAIKLVDICERFVMQNNVSEITYSFKTLHVLLLLQIASPAVEQLHVNMIMKL